MVELLLILAAAAAAAAALAGLGYLLVWFLLHGRQDGPGWEKLEGFRYAHRGLHGPGVPENSLGGLPPGGGGRIRRRTGCPSDPGWTPSGDPRRGFGADVRRSRSGGGKNRGGACRSPLAGSEEHIPLLEEVLPLFAGRAPLVVELKTDRHGAAALAGDTVDCLDRFSIDYCVESFDPGRCGGAAATRPVGAAGPAVPGFPPPSIRPGSLEPLGADESLLQCIHPAGFCGLPVRRPGKAGSAAVPQIWDADGLLDPPLPGRCGPCRARGRPADF